MSPKPLRRVERTERIRSEGNNVPPLYSSYGSPGTVSDLNWGIIQCTDFSADNKSDILWRNSTTGQLSIWLMDGTAYSSYGSPGTVSDLNWEMQ